MIQPALLELRDTVLRSLALSAADQRADYLPDNLGSAARVAVGDAVVAIIVGVDDDIAPLVERAHTWLEQSVPLGTAGNRSGYLAMQCAEALGVASWLLGDDASPAFAEAVSLHWAALTDSGRSEPLSPSVLIEHHLPDLVRDCFLAGRYDLGVRAYAGQLGPPPADPVEVRTPLELAGWLCHEVGRLRAPADWVAVGSRVLRERLFDWLDRGHGLSAALWLKLVFAESGAARTAAETLQRGGELIGALPVDPLADVLLDSLGDPVDVDLLAGFLAAVAASSMEGTLIVEFDYRAPLVVTPDDSEIVTGLDHAIAAALAVDCPGTLPDRLAAAVRGRVVDVDGETPLTVHEIRIS